MTDILFLAYQFAPLNTGGTFRSLYFVKYLKQFDINPIVLTLDPNSFSQVYKNYYVDEGLLNEIPANTDIRFIPSENTLELYNTPIKAFFNIYFELYAGSEIKKWKTALMAETEKVFHRYKPKAIFVSVPPFGMLQLGYEISKKYDLPLLLDFRDPWLIWKTTPFGSYFHYYLTKKREEKYIQAAKGVIATSDQTLMDFMTYHPQIDRKKYKLINNGYDEEIRDWALHLPPAGQKELTIGYVGSFYYDPKAREQMMFPWYRKKINRIFQYSIQKEDWLYRSPYFFFSAVKTLFELRPEFKNRIKIKFIGEIPYWLPEMIKDHELIDVCQLLGQKSMKESIDFQKSCDYLLITSSKVLKGNDYSIAGKTFEYFSMRKPIIAFVSSGAQKRMILNSGMGLICDPDNSQESAENLISLLEGKIELVPNKGFLDSLNRKNLSEKLASVIRETCA